MHLKIKNNSEGQDWNFEISNRIDLPVMIMENVNIDENIIGYIYVFKNNDNFIKDPGMSLQYKTYNEIIPIDVIIIKYKDFKKYYKVNYQKRSL